MADSGSTAHKRRHVTTACVPCRESKIRCDGAAPRCSSCESKGKDCRYLAGDDKRKLSIRVAIELLSDRIWQLTHFITQNSLQPPSMPDGQQTALMNVLDHLKLTDAYTKRNEVASPSAISESSAKPYANNRKIAPKPENKNVVRQKDGTQLPSTPKASAPFDGVPTNSPPTGNPPNILTNFEDMDMIRHLTPQGLMPASLLPSNWTAGFLKDMELSFQKTPPANLEPIESFLAVPGAEAEVGCDKVIVPQMVDDTISSQETDENDNTESLINQLSDRLGSLHIGSDGKIIYLGPTSNYNLVEVPSHSLAIKPTAKRDSQEHLDRLGIGKLVPLELEEHLTSLYFAWQNPTSYIVNRSMFETAKVRWKCQGEDDPYYSEALQNAMQVRCSMGATIEARHHSTFITFPKTLPEFFAQRAKALIDIELDSPSVATVQALIILSSHEIGYRCDSRGWLYSGMALRLAFDLALHIDPLPYIEKSKITQTESILRKDVFWSAYTTDRFWSLYLGRPFYIIMEDITVEKPSGGILPDCAPQWVSYGSTQPSGFPSSLPDYPSEVHRQRVLLGELMAPVGHYLYGTIQIPLGPLQEINAKTVENLLNWHSNLPLILKIDLDDQKSQYLPHVILLHMEYHQNIIYVHRPYMSKTYLQPSPPQGPGSSHARMMCVKSAVAIAQLIQIYEARYILRRMSVQGVGMACSAALILLFASISQYDCQTSNIDVHLNACLRALDELGMSWESAKSSKDFLMLLQRQWEIQTRSARGCQYSLATMKHQISKKRTRPFVDDSQLREVGNQGPQWQTDFGLENDSQTSPVFDWILPDAV